MAIESVEDIFSEDIAPHDVAAIVLEPVQGEGGFNVVPAEFLKRLRAICDKHGILLSLMKCNLVLLVLVSFMMNHYETKADPHHDGEKLGRRFPISRVVGRAEVMDAPNPGGLGGTYAGSPIGCSCACRD